MRRRGWRVGLTLLSAAAMLVGAIAPPVVQHAHGDGAVAHNHGPGADFHHHDAGEQGHPHHPSSLATHPHREPHAHGDHAHGDHEHGDHAHGDYAHGDYEQVANEPLRCLAGGATLHRHLTLFGWELYLPVGDPDGDPDGAPDGARDAGGKRLRLADVELLPLGPLPRLHVATTYFSRIAPVTCEPLSHLRPQAERARLAALPLCDRALRQRTGVLLI